MQGTNRFLLPGLDTGKGILNGLYLPQDTLILRNLNGTVGAETIFPLYLCHAFGLLLSLVLCCLFEVIDAL